MDHEAFLGDTVAKIAGEKAGIIKRGVPCVVGPQTNAGLEVIEAQAEKLGAPLLAYGQQWQVSEERGRLIFQDETGLLDLPLPNLPGAHQIQNAGAALAALRRLGVGEVSYEAAVTQADWPARMQRLKAGALVDAAGQAELWLDGGHNPAAGAALATHLAGLPKRPTHLICGMLNTKDIAGYLAPLAKIADGLTGVSIPGEANTIPGEDTARIAAELGISTGVGENVRTAIDTIVRQTPNARILICGSLYLAGAVLRENG